MFDFAIIGGGASGIYASILLAKKGYSVALFEANDRIGKKLLATGNGKCNLSNVDIKAEFYNNNAVDEIVSNFDMQGEMLKLGLVTKVKSGRIYPYSEQSNNVLNVLLCNLQRYGVKILTNHNVQEIKVDENYTIITNNGQIKCKRVCLATGSIASFGMDSLGLYKKFGCVIKKNTPSLAPLIATKLESIKGLAGVRQEAKVSLYKGDNLIAFESGEVQFRKDGISGIVIMNMCARMCWNNILDAVCYLDFMPDYSYAQVEEFLQNNITAQFGILNKNIMQNASKYGVNGIKKYPISVKRSEDFKLAQVASGGLDISQFDLKTMCLKTDKNLYAIGEALDVDGLCGGYNLHWAFASAYNFAKEFDYVAKA